MLMKLVTSGAVVAVLTMGAVNSAQAQTPTDKAIYFTFDQPVTVPQTTLPAGKYLFRLADSLSNRQIVQIYNAEGKDGGKLAAMMMTLPVSRSDVPNGAEIRFLETPADAPPAIATYWYPGQRDGWEFIYPRSQATTIAKASKQAVLTTSADVSQEDMKTASLVRMDASGQQRPAEAKAATAMSASSRTARGEYAEDSPAASSTRSPAAAPRSTASAQSSQTPAPARVQSSSGIASDETRRELPATASSTPTVALVGLVALAGALWLTRRAHA